MSPLSSLILVICIFSLFLSPAKGLFIALLILLIFCSLFLFLCQLQV
jgi:hypothetical protein